MNNFLYDILFHVHESTRLVLGFEFLYEMSTKSILKAASNDLVWSPLWKIRYHSHANAVGLVLIKWTNIYVPGTHIAAAPSKYIQYCGTTLKLNFTCGNDNTFWASNEYLDEQHEHVQKCNNGKHKL